MSNELRNFLALSYEELEELNDHIVGEIEVIHEFGP